MILRKECNEHVFYSPEKHNRSPLNLFLEDATFKVLEMSRNEIFAVFGTK